MTIYTPYWEYVKVKDHNINNLRKTISRLASAQSPSRNSRKIILNKKNSIELPQYITLLPLYCDTYRIARLLPTHRPGKMAASGRAPVFVDAVSP